MTAFVRWLPWDGGEGALEEGVVDDVSLVIFAFNDPVAGVGFSLAGVGENGSALLALRGVYEKRSTGSKGVHSSLLTAWFCRRKLFKQVACKKGVRVLVDFRKGFESFSKSVS